MFFLLYCQTPFRLFLLQPIPADIRDMRLRISIGKPNFVLPNLDSVNHCTSKEISIEIKRYLLVQWLTESIFGKTKFGFPIEIRSNQQRESHVCGDRL
jgi:hypothetical protein